VTFVSYEHSSASILKKELPEILDRCTIESILMRERQETGIAHPKKEYAKEKNALLVLNMAMIFIQRCL
jgi:hypothetical protein